MKPTMEEKLEVATLDLHEAICKVAYIDDDFLANTFQIMVGARTQNIVLWMVCLGGNTIGSQIGSRGS